MARPAPRVAPATRATFPDRGDSDGVAGDGLVALAALLGYGVYAG